MESIGKKKITQMMEEWQQKFKYADKNKESYEYFPTANISCANIPCPDSVETKRCVYVASNSLSSKYNVRIEK